MLETDTAAEKARDRQTDRQTTVQKQSVHPVTDLSSKDGRRHYANDMQIVDDED